MQARSGFLLSYSFSALCEVFLIRYQRRKPLFLRFDPVHILRLTLIMRRYYVNPLRSSLGNVKWFSILTLERVRKYCKSLFLGEGIKPLPGYYSWLIGHSVKPLNLLFYGSCLTFAISLKFLEKICNAL